MVSYVIRINGQGVTDLLSEVPLLSVFECGRTWKHVAEGRVRAHQAVVASAKACRLPYVWVLEDGCRFTDDFSLEWWESLGEWMLAAGVHVLCGGMLWTRGPVEVLSEDIVHVSGGTGTHCVIYHKDAYDTILSLPPHTHLDESIERTSLVKATTMPFMARQQPEFDIWYDKCEGEVRRHCGLTTT